MTRSLRYVMGCFAMLGLLAACSDGSDGPVGGGPILQGCADTGTCAANPPTMIGGARPAMVQVPSNYDVGTRYPLIVVLHGRGATGVIQGFYFGLFDRIDRDQFVLVYPDARPQASDGRRAWRSRPTCCDTPAEEAEELSDAPWLRRLIEEAAATYSIDATRVGLIGHSSGGFMSFTMACEVSDYVTSIVNLAGSTFADGELCAPAAERVSVLSVHGDMDDTVFYEGIEGVYLSAPEAARRFAMLAGCDADNPTAAGDIDIVESLDGAETSVEVFEGCLGQAAVEFWTINDGPHIPGPWVPAGLDRFVDWMLDHPRG